MPGSGSGEVPSAQGSTVSFDGGELGSLLSIRVNGPSVSGTDVTSLESPIAGSGAGAVMSRELDVLAIDPGSVSVTFFGAGLPADAGEKGELEVVVAGSTVLSGEAYLASYEIEATVGDFVRGSATFQLTGA